MTKVAFVLISGMTALSPIAWAQQTSNKVTLAAAGQPTAVIVLPDPVRDNPDQATPPMVEQAGKVLAEFLKRMTGASFQTVHCADLGEVRIDGDELTSTKIPAQSYILLGESDLTRRLKIPPTPEPGGTYTRAAGNVLTFQGAVDGTPLTGGVRYAVNQFLEDQGVCYLWPGELGLVVPSHRDLSVPYGVHRFTPPIKQRGIRVVLGSSRALEGARDLGIEADYQQKLIDAGALKVPFVTRGIGGWMEWQNTCGDAGIRGGHSLGDLWDRFGKTHPGWFALQPDGTRNQHNSDRAQLCLSNTELIQQVADDLIAKADKDPHALSLPLSLNDGGADAFCMCKVNALGEPGCVTYDPAHGRKIDNMWGWNIPYVSLTDRYMTFCNRVAEKVAVKYPHLLLVVDAYSLYASPPVQTTLHPNLVVRYVPSNMDDWDAWSGKASKIYWRPNGLGSGFRFGELKFNRDFGRDLSYAAHHSTIATDFDSLFNNWATEGLNYYVIAKLSWNPDLKIDDILDEYCRDGFGPANSSIRQYFKRVDEIGTRMYPRVAALAAGDPAKIAVSARADAIPEFWTPAVFAELHSLLQQADRQAAGDAPENQLIRRRIDFLRIGLDWTQMQSRAYSVLIAYNRKQPVDLIAAGQLLAERKVMMHRIFEQSPLAVNVANLNFGDRGYWQNFQKAVATATGTSKSKDGATTVDADENGRPIIVPQN